MYSKKIKAAGQKFFIAALLTQSSNLVYRLFITIVTHITI